MIFGGSQYFFRRELSEVSKNERMKFIALKTKDGELKGNIAFTVEFRMSAGWGFISIRRIKTVHGSISLWQTP